MLKLAMNFQNGTMLKKPTSYIIYLDANDSYEHCKIKLLPTQIPDRANPKDFSLNNYSKDSSLGCFL